MAYVKFEEIKDKYIQFWNKENHDRPIMALFAPSDKFVAADFKIPDNIDERWTDTEYIIKSNRLAFRNTSFVGDAFPALNPNLGPDILGAIMGCDLSFGENTSWAKHIVYDWDMLPDIKFDENNLWWKKIFELTKAAVDDSNGDYLVGVTDLHSGTDALVSLKGPENLCLGMFDCPELIKKFNWQIFEVYKKVYENLYNIISKRQDGVTNWMGIYHPNQWYVTSSDFSCLISEKDFDEFIIPELIEELNFLDASIYHLDGPGALKHLDRLIKIPNLNGIQWVYGSGQPTARYWIKELRKIQDSGKLIQVSIEPDDLKPLCEALRPEGVMFNCYCKNETQAKDMLAYAKDFYK